MTFRTQRLLSSLRHPVTEYQVAVAKRKHRQVNPHCASCDCARDPVTGKQNDVHHVIPVHVDPARATDPDNLITLCRHCHFTVGHMYDWKDYNEDVCNWANYLCGRYDALQAHTRLEKWRSHEARFTLPG